MSASPRSPNHFPGHGQRKHQEMACERPCAVTGVREHAGLPCSAGQLVAQSFYRMPPPGPQLATLEGVATCSSRITKPLCCADGGPPPQPLPRPPPPGLTPEPLGLSEHGPVGHLPFVVCSSPSPPPSRPAWPCLDVSRGRKRRRGPTPGAPLPPAHPCPAVCLGAGRRCLPSCPHENSGI